MGTLRKNNKGNCPNKIRALALAKALIIESLCGFFFYAILPFFLSLFEFMIAAEASPVMFSTVLPISNILSTPATRAIPSTGRPTDCKTMASMIIPDPGTPAVPIDASVEVLGLCHSKLL